MLPAMGWGQPYNLSGKGGPSITQSADSLRRVARFDSSNHLYQRAADRFEQQQKWLKKIEALYKISLNQTEQGQLSRAVNHLEKAFALFQSKELQEPGFEIKYHHQKAVIAEQQAEYDSALEWAEKGLKLANASDGQHRMKVKLHHTTGDIHISKGHMQKAIDRLSKAEDLYHRASVGELRLLSSIYNSYGTAYRNAGDQNLSLQYYRQSLEIKRKILPSPHPKLSQTQNNIAIAYYYQGDYQRALEYFINAVKVLAEFYGEEHSQVAAGYNNVGVVYSEIGNLEKATEYLEKSLAIKEDLWDTDHPDVAIGYQNLGTIHHDMEKYDQAIDYYKEAETLHLQQFPDGHPELANVYANMGEAYAAKEEYEQALDYYQRDLEINLESTDGSHPFIGDAYTKIGKIYARIENYQMALNHYHKALEVFTGDFNVEAGYENPPFEQVAYPNLLLETLASKGQALLTYGEESDQKDLLDRSLQTHLEAAELIDNLQRTYSREKSKLLLRERTVDIYDQGFKTAYLLQEITGDPQYKEYAFYFVEKSQNQVLLEQVRRINARDLTHIPNSLIDREHTLKKQLNKLQTDLYNLADVPQEGDSLQRSSLRDSLFYVRKDLEDHLRHLESSYPEYHELKYEPVVTSAKEIRENILSDDQVMVSYFFADESLFAQIVSKDFFAIRDLEADTLLKQDINDFRDTILKTYSPADFAEVSHKLYNKLIDPIADLITGKDLLIIPDGMLHYLPFESLVSDAVTDPKSARFHNLSYLLLNHTVHYASSAGFLELRGSADNPPHKKQLAGFAPGFSEITSSQKHDLYPGYERSLSSLPLSKKEITDLENLFNNNGGIWSLFKPKQEQADIFIGDTASESTFKALPLSNYRYIHLATHAFVSEDRPERSGILFSAPDNSGQDGTLYADEIYNLQLNARLVTLSACKTGFGAIAEGEGMMSLSRAFQYAGARNLLVSLWNVSDRSTARLMVDFYKQNRRQSMPAALQNAKSTMIDDGPYAHPKYWAPFVLIGSAR